MFYRRHSSHSYGFLAAVLLLALLDCSLIAVAQKSPLSPSDTVREFYKALREKRFREAFALSIYKPAIEGLKPQEFEDLRPDFEKLAGVLPEKVDITGEQISGDEATVFMKLPREDDPAQSDISPISLIRAGDSWILGDKDNQEVVKKAGKKFFFDARIDTHHSEVQAMLQRINLAQLAYFQQHGGLFADMPTLITVGLLPRDLEGTESTGYRFHITLGKDAKSFTVSAEPAQYGRTGRLSFFMDRAGVRSGDVGGKALPVPPLVP